MADLILHHFEASPFSEKIRLILGYKQLAWRSVLIPRILPKPDLMPLTGGYRRTPVLQIGRDIYADTRLIATVLDRVAPAPTLVDPKDAASSAALVALADQTLFLAAIPVIFRPEGRAVLEEKLGGDYLDRFSADRGALFSGGTVSRPDDQFSRATFEPTLAALDSQLAGRRFLLGDTPQLADFSIYHPVWYVRANAGVAPLLDAYPNILGWADRMAAIGHGSAQDMSGDQAQAEAAGQPPFAELDTTIDASLGFAAGQAVAVSARDYGTDAVRGRLVHADSDCVVIEREAERIGTLRNHFPRQGFRIDAG